MATTISKKSILKIDNKSIKVKFDWADVNAIPLYIHHVNENDKNIYGELNNIKQNKHTYICTYNRY